MRPIWREQSPAGSVLGYGAAVLSVLIAILIYTVLGTQAQQSPFILFLGAVAFSAWFGGLGPGLLVTLLSASAAAFIFLPPQFVFDFSDPAVRTRVVLFLVVALLINGLSYARARAHAGADEERARWQVTLASIGDAVIATGSDGRVTFMNKVAELLTGWTAAEAERRDLSEVFHVVNQETREPVESPYTRVMREGSVVGLANHTIIIARDGSERPIDDSGAPIFEDGKITGVVLVFRDVTERARAERALVESEARFRQLADSAPVLIWIADAEGRRYFFNRTWLDFTGRTLEQQAGNGWIEGIHPDDRGSLDIYMAAVRAGQSFRMEYRLRRKSGKYASMLSSGVPLLGAGGEVMGYIGTVTDISEIREAESERILLLEREREARAEAEEAQRRFAFLAEASRVLASSLDYETTLVTVAKQAVPQIADWCAIDLLDEEGTLQRLAVEHVDPARVEWAHEIYAKYPPKPDDPTGVYNVLRTGKSEFYPEITDDMLAASARSPEELDLARSLGITSVLVVPLVARDHALGALSFVTAESHRRLDESDVTLAEDLALRAANSIENSHLYKEAQAAVRVRDHFVSVASHELRTPLSAMLGYTQLAKRRLQRSGTAGETEVEMLGMVEKQAFRLNQMVTSMLDLSRIETGQLSIERADADLAGILQQIVDELQPTLARHRIELKCPPRPVVIEGDRLRLEQVVQNLIQNAAKYSPDGGPIRVRLTEEEGMARIDVTDRGIGIPEAAIPRLFQRFYRAPNADSQQYSGMGIGLYVVKEIVNLHGGTVTVQSKEGEGSTFTIRLPLHSDPS